MKKYNINGEKAVSFKPLLGLKKYRSVMSKLLFFFLVISIQLFSQELSYLPYGYYPRNCKFFGEDIGYYICEGSIYKTFNGGKNWNLIYRTGIYNNFRKTVFAGEKNIWLVTSNHIVHSKNGGLSFDSLSSLPGWITDISFCDSVNGWALIGNYSLYKTTNSGITWSQFYNSIFARNIQLVTKNVGYISDYFKLIKTTDGGNNFYNVFSASSMIDFSFSSPNVGICSYWSNPNIRLYTTTNGGFSWNQRETIPNGGLGYLDYSGNIIAVTGYHFSGGGPFLWISTNSGVSWEKSAEKSFKEISTINANLMYGIDDNRLYKIINVGQNSIEIPIIPPIKFSKIKGNGTIEWAIGSFYSTDSNKTYSYLVDKGPGYSGYYYIKSEWENCKFTSLYINQDSLAFIGGFDIPSNTPFILRSTDLGKSWIKVYFNASGPINSFYYLNNSGYFGVGNNGTLIRSTNDGLNWEQIDLQISMNLNSITGIDNLILAAGDLGSIFRSTDNGNSWEKITVNFSNHIRSLAIKDYSTVWGVGSNGLITVSSDAGLNWVHTENTEYDYEVIVIDNHFGYFGGKNNINKKAFWGWSVGPLNFTSWTLVYGDWGTVNDLQPYLKSGNEIYIACDNGNLVGFIYGRYLPVEITSLSALYNNSKVTLEWATSSETNNYGFEIQSRYNDVPWYTIGFKHGRGNSVELNNYSFIHDVSHTSFTGVIFYRLKQIDYDGSFEYSDEIEVEVNVVSEFALFQNYPNPFNPTTTIKYAVANTQQVQLKIYDVLGNKIATLVNEEKQPGKYEVVFDAAGISSGIYFYQLRAGTFSETKKLVLLR